MVRAAGSALYDAGGNNSFEPASTIKIVTAAAALDVLGPTTRYRTTVHASEPPVQGVVRGDLWLVGSGDPVLSTDEWASNFTREQPFTSLNRLAENLAAAGVRVIEGRVLGDDSRYDDQRYVEAWPSRLIGDGEIGPLSALTVNDGFATWGHPGRPFADPPMDAATIFKTLMQRNGIRVVGGTGSGRAVPGSVELAAVESFPMSEIVSGMLKESDNGTAELLVKEIGLKGAGTGSTEAGTRAIEEWLANKGMTVDQSNIGDGSGLSPSNRLSCRLLADVLSSFPGPLRQSLPVAGGSGTLSRRFVGTPVAGRMWAKTGSLDGVRALAGYAQNAANQTLIFVYIVNGLPRSASATALQESLANALVTGTLETHHKTVEVNARPTAAGP